jgi:hypothetical protein
LFTSFVSERSVFNLHKKMISTCQVSLIVNFLSSKPGAALYLFLASICLILNGCATVASPVVNATSIAGEPPSGFFIPTTIFSKTKQTSGLSLEKAHPSLASSEAVKPFATKVVLYTSPSTEKYLVGGKLDAGNSPQVWEVFLKKYKIPYQIATTTNQLNSSEAGVLVLPSSVALSKREKQAIVDFRARGGSVLATWLCGVRDETGTWVGFEFMEKVLDAKVVGDTSREKDDNFLMPNGDSPVSNALPAGRRVWLERVKEWYPLRLVGRNGAAHIMDWSRTFDNDKETSVMVYDERDLAPNGSSRSVVIGYPERLWQTADPEHIEAINFNALSWLLRLPSAYKAAWPAPYKSAMSLTIDAAEVIAEPDMAIASLFENIGARATYYSVAEHVPKSAKNLNELQKRGHELAFMGDTFNGFKGQPSATQVARIAKMQLKFKEAGVVMPPNPGFHAPIESYDKNTETALVQAGFGHYVSFMDATDSRLPFMATPSTVVLPRTQRGPEDATEEGDVDDGLKSFFAELTLAETMGGLSVIRLPTQSILLIDDWTKVAGDFRARKERMWMTTGAQIAQWWRERSRVDAAIGGNSNAPELKVNISGSDPLKNNLVIWVNLPVSGSALTIVAGDTSKPQDPLPKVFSVDKWRAGILLADLKPGSYRWRLQFKS